MNIPGWVPPLFLLSIPAVKEPNALKFQKKTRPGLLCQEKEKYSYFEQGENYSQETIKKASIRLKQWTYPTLIRKKLDSALNNGRNVSHKLKRSILENWEKFTRELITETLLCWCYYQFLMHKTNKLIS